MPLRRQASIVWTPLRNNQYQGLEPSKADVLAALAAMERMVPELLAYLK